MSISVVIKKEEREKDKQLLYSQCQTLFSYGKDSKYICSLDINKTQILTLTKELLVNINPEFKANDTNKYKSTFIFFY